MIVNDFWVQNCDFLCQRILFLKQYPFDHRDHEVSAHCFYHKQSKVCNVLGALPFLYDIIPFNDRS